MSQNETEIRLIDPLELHPNPVNVKIYGEEEVDPELVESIDKKGQLDPLVITDDNIIISGHRRWLALKTLGKHAKCLFIHFDTELDKWEAIIECNRQREKTTSQIYNESKILKSIYAERAKQRQLATLKQNAENPETSSTDVLTSAPREESGKTRDIMAKKTGVKRDTFVKITFLGEKAESGDEVAKQVLKKADSGEITINAAVNTLKVNDIANSDVPEAESAKILVDEINRGTVTPTKALQRINAEMKAEKEKTEAQSVKTAKISQGKFNVIVSDTYPIADIINKKIPNDEDSVLFLWSTANSLPGSLDLMGEWGFEYKSCAILDKEIKGSGSLFLTSHDLLLVGIHGAGLEPVSKVSSVIHGKKHDCIYDMIEKMFPAQKYLELFKVNTRKGWNVSQVDEALQHQPLPETETQTDDTTLQAITEKEAQEPIKPEEPEEQEPEPEEALKPEHTVSGESQAPVATIEKQHNDTLDKPFSLYVGTRDMGVQEEFINHELGFSEQCNAIHKEQVVTELWDNKKHKLIFTFDEKLSPDQIVRTADKKISDYLDAEEHLPPEPIKPEEAPQPEPEPQSEAVLKLDTTQVKVNETIKQDNVAEEMQYFTNWIRKSSIPITISNI